jgi:acyl-CoA synthetase (AMP-forming)/AMP-acid ligase II
MNIVDPILFQCRYQPPAAAICAPGTGIGLISYGRLEQFIHNIGRRVLTLDLSPGSIVAILIEDPIFHAAIVLAFTRLGIVTFSARGEQFPDEMKVDAVISDKPLPSLPTHRIVLADMSWTTGDGRPVESHYVPRSTGSDICRIVLTSGTTGDAKAVAISHKLLSDRIGRIHMVYGPRLNSCSRIFCDVSFNAWFGFQFFIHTLWRGGTYFLPGDSFESTIEAFEYYKVQGWVVAPGGLANMLSHFEQYSAYQSRAELIISGGDLLSKSLSERVRARICSHLISAYGSTETGTVASAPAHAISHMRGAVGYINPGISVQITNETGRILPTGSDGIVRIRSELGVEGYVGNPVDSASVFKDGWFYPGDTGALTSDNVLLITGRQKAVLSIGGDKFKPEMVEEVLAAFPAVDQAAVFSLPNELGIDAVSAVIMARSNIDKDQLRAHCEARLPRQVVPVDFIFVDKIPRNAMGKIDRAKLPELAKSKIVVYRQ